MSKAWLPKFQNPWQRLRYTRAWRLPGHLLGKWRLWRSGVGPTLVRMRLGHEMLIPPTQPYLRRAIVSGAYHDEDVFFLAPHLGEGAVVIDVGANIGLLSCAYARHHAARAVTVHAIEAVAANYHLLEENIRRNPDLRVVPHRLALGERAGTLVFKLPSAGFVGNAVGMNVLGPADAAQAARDSSYEESVSLETLDAWARGQGITRCDFLKIDVEGAELAVLRGGETFLRATLPVVQCEYNRHWLVQQGIGPGDFEAFFAPLGYDAYVDTGDSYRPLRAGDAELPLVDFLFVPRR